MALLLLSSLALAHPMGSDLYGHRTELRLAPGQLEVDYTLEVPTPAMLRDLRRFLADAPPGTPESAYGAAFRQELVDGLTLRVDDAPATWRVEQAAPDAARSDPRFVTANLRLSVALPVGARTLQIVDGNLPDEASLYLVDVLASDALQVDACSLWDLDAAGQIRHDRGGQWRMEEDSRDLRLSFRARPAWQRALLRLTRVVGGRGEAGGELAGATHRRDLRVSMDPRGAWLLGLGLVTAGLLGLLGLPGARIVRILWVRRRGRPEAEGRGGLLWRLGAVAAFVALLGGALFIWAGVQSAG